MSIVHLRHFVSDGPTSVSLTDCCFLEQQLCHAAAASFVQPSNRVRVSPEQPSIIFVITDRLNWKKTFCCLKQPDQEANRLLLEAINRPTGLIVFVALRPAKQLSAEWFRSDQAPNWACFDHRQSDRKRPTGSLFSWNNEHFCVSTTGLKIATTTIRSLIIVASHHTIKMLQVLCWLLASSRKGRRRDVSKSVSQKRKEEEEEGEKGEAEFSKSNDKSLRCCYRWIVVVVAVVNKLYICRWRKLLPTRTRRLQGNSLGVCYQVPWPDLSVVL